jgi:hypothetical protein
MIGELLGKGYFMFGDILRYWLWIPGVGFTAKMQRAQRNAWFDAISRGPFASGHLNYAGA